MKPFSRQTKGSISKITNYLHLMQQAIQNTITNKTRNETCTKTQYSYLKEQRWVCFISIVVVCLLFVHFATIPSHTLDLSCIMTSVLISFHRRMKPLMVYPFNIVVFRELLRRNLQSGCFTWLVYLGKKGKQTSKQSNISLHCTYSSDGLIGHPKHPDTVSALRNDLNRLTLIHFRDINIKERLHWES